MFFHRRVVKHPRFSRISPLFLATKVHPSAGRCTPPIVVTSCLRVSWSAARQGDKKRQDRWPRLQSVPLHEPIEYGSCRISLQIISVVPVEQCPRLAITMRRIHSALVNGGMLLTHRSASVILPRRANRRLVSSQSAYAHAR